MSDSSLSIDFAVNERYGQAARMTEPELCCPVQYDIEYLRCIPQEILERDYGCGDPTAYVQSGETVLDLGSGGGKLCYIAVQVVGPTGRVIGIDANDEMLSLAEKYRQSIGDTLGYHNVEFHKARIQDLRLDLGWADAYLCEHPVRTVEELHRFEDACAAFRRERPLIADESVDVVLSNCVLNLVAPEDKERLFAEIFRVVRRGGRAVISDIVCDEDVPDDMRQDAHFWSGCISGAYREDAFLAAFERAGFHGVEIVNRAESPWQTIRGIEFRSMTVRAYKGKQGPCYDRKQAVIYRGPWRKVFDDDGHMLERGAPVAVCDKTFQLYTREPYKDQIIPVEPYEDIALAEAPQFDCNRSTLRSPRETKGEGFDATIAPASLCGDPGSCC